MNNVNNVAILILLELTLQLYMCKKFRRYHECRNPYFIGINSAIIKFIRYNSFGDLSQSLFYWN